TVWLPTAKRCGLVMTVVPSLYTVLATPQLSVGVAAKVTLALHAPALLLTAMSAGTLTTGFSLSVTVTVKLPLALLPWMSLTLTSTVWLPTGKRCGLVMTVVPSLYTVLATPQL